MKIITKHDNGSQTNIQRMAEGQIFRFAVKGETFESALVNGELFMIISSNPQSESISDKTIYVRLSDKFEYVTRTGPIFGHELDDELTVALQKSSSTTIEQTEVGNIITFDHDDCNYLIVTDPVDTTKMVSLLNLSNRNLIKLSKESSCYVREANIVVY